MSNDARTREEIERDIAAKRAALSENVTRLKSSLSIGSVAHEVGKFGLKHAGGVGTSALKQVKRNPLPVATIGLGLAWLIYSNSKTDATSQPKEETDPERGEELVQSDLSTSQKTDQVRDTEKQSGLFNAHPLALGGIALAAGAILGGLLPRSKTEDELVSSAKDLIRAETERLSNIAQTVMEEAEDIIAETKADLDRGAPHNYTTAQAVEGLAREAADRMVSTALTAAKDTKRG